MPPSGNVVHQDKKRRGGGVVQSGPGKARRDGRQGVPLDIDDAAGSYLSPTRLLTSFSNMGISRYREYLPGTETAGGRGSSRAGKGEEGAASWQRCDLRDGHGRRPLLVVTSPLHPLQIFSIPHSTIPDDPHVQEVHPAPQEILSIKTLRDDPQCQYTSPRSERNEEDGRVLSAKLVDRGPLCGPDGPVALLVVAARSGRGAAYALSLEVLNLRSGTVVKKVNLGSGKHAAVEVSPRAVVVSVVQTTASLLVLGPSTLSPLCPPIEHLPVDPRSVLPVFAIAGRLIAYTTSDAPRRPGPDGVGSLVTTQTLRARTRTQAKPPGSPYSVHAESSSAQASNQNVILNSAVEIGGGVARGVWAGLKMGAQAAGRAANQRLASSAPARGSLEIEAADAGSGSLESPDDTATSESRSLDESCVLDDMSSVEPGAGGQWIKIVDLCPVVSPSPERKANTVAHFRLPRSNREVATPTNGKHQQATSRTQPRAISYLAFSPDGASLFVAPADGRTFHILDVHPDGPDQLDQTCEVAGEVWHTYELRRGNTVAAVSDVQWSADGRWIGVATQRGTVHVFAINPSGGTTSAATHVPVRLPNPSQLHPLSTIVTPTVRVRFRLRSHADQSQLQNDQNSFDTDLIATFTFLQYRQNPLRPGMSCLDMALYRPTLGQLDLARISAHGVQPAHAPVSEGTRARETDLTKRASALTEMMKTRVGMANSDLEVKSVLKATWQLPSGPDGDTADLVLPAGPRSDDAKSDVQRSARRHRAHIEIQSFSHDTRLLPSTIYLSHQVDCYDARPIDEYSRTSIMDREARTRRIHFRPEVEIHSSTPDAKSFDEPLSSALHSVIESSPSSQLPGLPNGHGQRQWKASIPIRQVKEGALHLRREYAKSRSSRRRSVNANALSFEEDTVFPPATAQTQTGSADAGSSYSPLSSDMPNTDNGPDDMDDDDDDHGDRDWSVKWEDEYERAVQDDGGPDDLVLGLMDEQEEERRRWVERQKRLAEQYAKG